MVILLLPYPVTSPTDTEFCCDSDGTHPPGCQCGCVCVPVCGVNPVITSCAPVWPYRLHTVSDFHWIPNAFLEISNVWHPNATWDDIPTLAELRGGFRQNAVTLSLIGLCWSNLFQIRSQYRLGIDFRSNWRRLWRLWRPQLAAKGSMGSSFFLYKKKLDCDTGGNSSFNGPMCALSGLWLSSVFAPSAHKIDRKISFPRLYRTLSITMTSPEARVTCAGVPWPVAAA